MAGVYAINSLKTLLTAILLLGCSLHNFAHKQPARLKVVVFYSPQCPVCNANLFYLQKLEKKYHGQVNWEIILPQLVTQKQFSAFKKKMPPIALVKYDRSNELVKQYKASVTPEVFLVDSLNNVIYSGKINNLFETVSTKRPTATENFLQNAIDSALVGKQIQIRRTEPIGCIIYPQ